MDLMAPWTLSPRLKLMENSSHGFWRHCFMPSEMRRRSSSISRTMTSTSSPRVTTLRGSTFLLVQRSEEHTSELQSLMRISYAVFCLKKKTEIQNHIHKQSTDKNTY